MLAGKVDGADDVLLVESLDGVGAGGRHPPLPRRPVWPEPVGGASLMGEPAGEGLQVVGVIAQVLQGLLAFCAFTILEAGLGK